MYSQSRFARHALVQPHHLGIKPARIRADQPSREPELEAATPGDPFDPLDRYQAPPNGKARPHASVRPLR
jgi:hypothetical protein